MVAAIFKAAIPEPYRILGVQLLPLSLGRYRLMQRFEVSFVSDEAADASISDLLLGVLICSLPCQEFQALLVAGELPGLIRRWSRRIGVLPPWWMLFTTARWRRRHSFNYLEKCHLFQRYIIEGSEVPKYFDEPGDIRPSGAHWSHAVEVILRSKLGWTSEEIEEAPLTKALSDYFKFAENEGFVRLMTEEDLAMGEANAAAFQKALNGTPTNRQN